jgi:hypothetical protein
MTTKNLSSIEMARYVDDTIVSKVGDLLNEEKKTISAVEMSLTAILGMSIGASSSSIEEIETQIQAYTMFLTQVAIGAFVENQPQSKPN